MERPTGDEMQASAPAYAPDRSVAPPKPPRPRISEPVERYIEPDRPANGYNGISEEVVCGPTPPAKRAIDVVAGSMLIGVLWPLWALAALLIKVDSPGPVFVRQKRVGLNGAEFRFLKFRTMHHEKKQEDLHERLPVGDLTRRLLSPRGRPRNATAVGWALRKTTVYVSGASGPPVFTNANCWSLGPAISEPRTAPVAAPTSVTSAGPSVPVCES